MLRSKAILAGCTLSVLSNCLFAQSIKIKLKTGSSISASLSDVRKLTFAGSDLVLLKNDHSQASWSLSEVAYVSSSPSIATGNTKPSGSDNFFFYPNPVQDQLTVSYTLDNPENIRIEISDIQGKSVLEFNEGLQPSGEHRTILHTGDLPKGIYILRLNTSDQSTSDKFIVY